MGKRRKKSKKLFTARLVKDVPKIQLCRKAKGKNGLLPARRRSADSDGATEKKHLFFFFFYFYDKICLTGCTLFGLSFPENCTAYI